MYFFFFDYSVCSFSILIYLYNIEVDWYENAQSSSTCLKTTRLRGARRLITLAQLFTRTCVNSKKSIFLTMKFYFLFLIFKIYSLYDEIQYWKLWKKFVEYFPSSSSPPSELCNFTKSNETSIYNVTITHLSAL